MINTQSLEDYFLQFRNVPDVWDDANNFLNSYLTQSTNFLNSKAIGIYSTQSIPCGKQLYLGQKSYDVFRLTLDFGALPNAAAKVVAHNISPYTGFRLLNMFLSATDSTTGNAFSLQYYSIAGGDITLQIDPTNVTVTTASNYSAYNVSYVIIEFLVGVP